MDAKERTIYEESLKDYWDLKSAIETYYKDGQQDGKLSEKRNLAINALKEGLDITLIIKLTNLSYQEVEGLKEDLKNND